MPYPLSLKLKLFRKNVWGYDIFRIFADGMIFINVTTKFENMVLLKEDGSLDIERINKLPNFEWMNLMGELSDEQFEEYISKSPINESTNNEVYYTTDEELDRNGFIDLNTAINNLKKEFGFI